MAGLITRGEVYYAVYYVGKKQKRVSLETSSLQLAKDKLRQLESSLYRGNDNPLPTKTPIDKVLTKYIKDMQARKTAKSVQRDISYLRAVFGPICPDLVIKNQKISDKGIKRPSRHAHSCIEANCFEQITTDVIATFISNQVRRKGLAPKTANRYREILTRLYNWAMVQNGVRMPKDKNPAALVETYRERASEISFLKLEQIDKQLDALKSYPALQTIVAVYIYAGLRREELCWLTVDDVDFEAGCYGMIRIRAKTFNGKKWEPKTKVNRVVPISKTLRSYLDKYAPPKLDGNWFFSTTNSFQWDPDNLSRTLRRENKKLKLEWTCLEYRHTFGSQLAMKGESLYKISAIMGNSPEICRKHYAALLPESLVDSVEFGNVTDAPSLEKPEPEQPTQKPLAEVIAFERPKLKLVVNNR